MMLPLIKDKPSEIHYRLKVSKNTCKSIEQADFFSSGIITGTSPLLLIITENYSYNKTRHEAENRHVS